MNKDTAIHNAICRAARAQACLDAAHTTQNEPMRAAPLRLAEDWQRWRRAGTISLRRQPISGAPDSTHRVALIYYPAMLVRAASYGFIRPALPSLAELPVYHDHPHKRPRDRNRSPESATLRSL